jgi:hypothetical protein
MAKIDVTKIAGYNELSLEEKLAALESFEYEDNANELERMKNAVSKSNSEAAEWRRKHNALLTEEEQKKQAADEELVMLREKVAAMEKATSISEHKAKFIGLGYDEKLAAETAVALVDGNFDKVFSNTEKFKADLEKRIKAEALMGMPTPDGNTNKGASVTKEQFAGMGYSERNKLFTENKALYTELMNGGNN